MAIVLNVTKPLAIPHEPGNEVIIRRISRVALRHAADLRQIGMMRKMQDLGGPKAIAELDRVREEISAQHIAAAETVVAETGTPAPLTPVAPPTPSNAGASASYDQDALLNAGIVAWSGPGYDGHAVSSTTIAALDAATADWLADEIAAYANGLESTEKNG